MAFGSQRREFGIAAVVAVIVALSLAGVVSYSFPPATTTGSTQGTGTPVPISSVETANITIGGSPRTIAVNPNTSRIYVADYFSNTLTVVDSRTNSVVARVALPADNNNGIAIDSNTNTIYVLTTGGVVEVNGTSNQIVAQLPFDFGPGTLAYDPSNRVVYGFIGGGNGSLVGVDVQTGKVVLNVSLGFGADSVVVNPLTHLVFAAGCDPEGLVCNSVVSLVNGISGKVLNTVPIGNFAYPRVTMSAVADVAYVSGSAQLVALNGTTGSLIYAVNSLACGPFDSMVTDPSSHQVDAVSLDYNYVLAYDGTSGALVNMYSFSTSPDYIALDPNTNVMYVTVGSQLLAFQSIAGAGHVNSTLVGSGQSCPIP